MHPNPTTPPLGLGGRVSSAGLKGQPRTLVSPQLVLLREGGLLHCLEPPQAHYPGLSAPPPRAASSGHKWPPILPVNF